jgi:hypothetical protein
MDRPSITLQVLTLEREVDTYSLEVFLRAKTVCT